MTRHKELQKEVCDLAEAEEQLDQLVSKCSLQLRLLTEDPQNKKYPFRSDKSVVIRLKNQNRNRTNVKLTHDATLLVYRCGLIAFFFFFWDISCTVFLNGCVRHVGLRPLPRSEEVVRFPRSAGHGDPRSARDTDASVGTEQGAGAKSASVSRDASACPLSGRSHLFCPPPFLGL